MHLALSCLKPEPKPLEYSRRVSQKTRDVLSSTVGMARGTVLSFGTADIFFNGREIRCQSLFPCVCPVHYSLLLLLLFCLFVFSISRLRFRTMFVLLVGCLTSQQHASESQGRICENNFTCCHTEIEVADQTFHLTQSQYTDTRANQSQH